MITFDDDETLFEKSVTKFKSVPTYIEKDIAMYIDKFLSKNLSNKDIEEAKNSFGMLNDLYDGTSIIYTPEEDDDFEEIIEFILNNSPNDVNLNWINTSKVTSMENVFNETQFNGDISNWDVSNVKNMSKMFRSCPFNGDISNWDVSNVEDMSFMFANNSEFNQNLRKWNTGHVKTMRYMFSGAASFNMDTIINWDYHRCRDRYTMTYKPLKIKDGR